MNESEPIFKKVFDTSWDNLPSAFKKRYSNRVFSNDIVTVAGKMDIVISKYMRLFTPIVKFLNILVPYEGQNIPVKVDFCSHTNSNLLFLNRIFYFAGNKAYNFNTTMNALGKNDVIESIFFNLGWRTTYYYSDKKVIMQHKGYVLRLFNFNLPLPLSYLFGIIHAEEELIDDNAYRITMIVNHPWFGELYRYAGDFTFTENKA